MTGDFSVPTPPSTTRQRTRSANGSSRASRAAQQPCLDHPEVVPPLLLCMPSRTIWDFSALSRLKRTSLAPR